MKLTPRGFLLSVSLGLAVMAVAACGSDKKDDTSSSGAASADRTQAPSSGYTAAPKDQQTFIVNLGSEPDFLDPHKSQFEQDIAVERLLFRGLFYTDQNGTAIPGVAKEVPTQQNGGISADGKTMTIKLKDGQKWSDGSPLTAKDFEYSIKRAFNPKVASPYASFVFNIAGSKAYNEALGTAAAPKTPSDAELAQLRDAVGVKALNDTTLEVKLIEPQPTMPVILAMWVTYPVKQSVVEASGAIENNAWTDPGKLIGNGPFVLKERKPKDRIVLEANPNYTLDPKPKLNRIDMRIIEDEEVAFNAWQTGELDMAGLPASKVPLVDADPNLKKLNVRTPSPTSRGVEFQHTVKPLDNANVRLAIAKSIDRDAFIKVIRAGVGEPLACWMPPGVPAADVDCGAQKYDPTAAKKLLSDAGFPNGQGFPELSFLSSSTPLGKNIAEFIQKQLKDNLNITIKIDLVDSKTRSSRYSNSQFELFYGGWHEDYHDPENWLPELHETGAGNNQDKYSNPKFDALMKQAKFEPNNEKRISLYKEGHKLLVDDAARANVESSVRNAMVKSKVKNLAGNSQDSGFTGHFNIEQLEIAKE